MQQYTIYEDHPDLSFGRPYPARIFEVSQTVEERDDRGDEADPQKPIVAPGLLIHSSLFPSYLPLKMRNYFNTLF